MRYSPNANNEYVDDDDGDDGDDGGDTYKLVKSDSSTILNLQ